MFSRFAGFRFARASHPKSGLASYSTCIAIGVFHLERYNQTSRLLAGIDGIEFLAASVEKRGIVQSETACVTTVSLMVCREI